MAPARLVVCPQQGDDLFGVNNPHKSPFVIDDRERAEIVFVEELGNFATVGINVAAYDVSLRQRVERCA